MHLKYKINNNKPITFKNYNLNMTVAILDFASEMRKSLPQNVNLRQIKYLNNIVEQDHRSIKRIVRPMLGFQSFLRLLRL